MTMSEDDVGIVGAIQDRLLAAVRDTQPSLDPFPFQSGPIGLKPDHFERLRQAFPAEAVRRNSAPGEYGETQRILLHLKTLDWPLIPEWKQEFIKALTQPRFSVRLARAMIERYIDWIPCCDHDGNNALPQTRAFRQMLLSSVPDYQWSFTRDLEGYELPVHTDIVRKMLTLLIYCSPEGNDAVSGTAVLRPKPGLDLRDMRGNTRFPFDQFDLVVQAPHSGNTFLSFCKNDVSFHGVPFRANQPYPRDNLMFNVWRPGA